VTRFSTSQSWLESLLPPVCWGFGSFSSLQTSKNDPYLSEFIENFYLMILKLLSSTFSRFSSSYKEYRNMKHCTPAAERGGMPGISSLRSMSLTCKVSFTRTLDKVVKEVRQLPTGWLRGILLLPALITSTLNPALIAKLAVFSTRLTDVRRLAFCESHHILGDLTLDAFDVVAPVEPERTKLLLDLLQIPVPP
jgi:hypothetical protein